MKLNSQELQFIDNYLKESGVKHFDIRLELTDHIASAVEEKMQNENIDFYLAFKNYMVWNKRELIKRSKYSWRILNKFIVKFLKGFLHPTLIVFIIIGYGITEYFISFNKTAELVFLGAINKINLLLFAPLAFMFFLYSRKRRYAVVDSMGIVIILTYYIFLIISYLLGAFSVTDLIVYKLLIGIYITCILVYMRVVLVIKKECDKIYL